jgi:hypothetical protein
MDAQVLLARMQESPHVSARPGWLVLLQSLLRRGHHRKVMILLMQCSSSHLLSGGSCEMHSRHQLACDCQKLCSQEGKAASHSCRVSGVFEWLHLNVVSGT